MANVTTRTLRHKLKSMFAVASGGILIFGAIGLHKGDPTLYKSVVMPAIRTLDPEMAHRVGVLSAKYGFFPKLKASNSELLKISVLGMDFPSPLGLAAGFDKHGEAVTGLFKMGFSFVEIGSVTPEPQPGNAKPRLFRLFEDKAVINRYGFNSEGHEIVRNRLQKLQLQKNRILGVNLGKNKTTPDAAEDYIKGIECFARLADFLVINISSPNTPGLRDMQKKEELDKLLDKIISARNELKLTKKIPILVKIAPDLTYEECKNVADIAVTKNIDGLIISNTTTTRPHNLKSTFKNEEGGLSGLPLCQLSTKIIKDMFILTKGKIPIIGVGGVFSGKDAYEKIRAGASLVEIYTALVYEGPLIVSQIQKELEILLRHDNFSSVSEAVGVDVK